MQCLQRVCHCNHDGTWQRADDEEHAVYIAFAKAAKGQYTVPMVVAALAISQAAQILASYWLVWWQQDEFNEPRGFYMFVDAQNCNSILIECNRGIYAGLGVAQAIGMFLMGASAAFFSYNASKSLHFGAFNRTLLAPMSYFDTTPLGRIISRYSKDTDTIDNTVGSSRVYSV